NPRVMTAATQPFPIGVEPIGPTCTPADMVPEGFELLCHYDPVDYDLPNGMYIVSTVRAARLAYSPDTRYVYMASSPWPLYLRRFESPRFFDAVSLRGIPGMKIKSELIAFDTQSNKVAWRVPKPYEIRNGSG